MAKVYNQIGALAQLLTKLQEHGVQDFETMDDIRAFRAGYKKSLQAIKQTGYDLVKQEIANLESKHLELSSRINSNIKDNACSLKNELSVLKSTLMKLNNFLDQPQKITSILKRLFFWFKKRKIIKRLTVLTYSFESEVRKPFKRNLEHIGRLQSEINDKKDHIEEWAMQCVSDKIERQEFILSVFKENKFLFYGAEGEERALQELSKLPNTYTVINDYRLRFSSPIYDKRNDDQIYSIQVDHLVVGPTGLYLVETKNWSKHSVESLDLFSPVKQLCRHNFAMFVILNRAIENGEITGFLGNWGARKISPKNIILMTGHKPQEKYQYVTIVSAYDIMRYISREKEIFKEKQIKSLISYLIEY